MSISLNQIAQRVRAWQAQGLLLKLLLWFWVAMFLFIIVTSILGVQPLYEHWFSRFGKAPYRPAYRGSVFLLMSRDAVVAISYFSASVWFVVNYAGKGMSLLAAYVLLCFGFAESSFTDTYIRIYDASPAFLDVFILALYFISHLVFVYFILLFPNGKFMPRWSRYYALGWTVLLISYSLFPSMPFNFMYKESFDSNRFNPLALVIFYLVPVGIQIYKHYVHLNQLERRQSRWIVFGILAALFGAFWDYGVRPIFASDMFPVDENGIRQPVWLVHYGRNIFQSIGYSVFPFTLLYALSKNRIWRVDPFVRRSMVYSSLTLIVVLIYGSLIAILNAAFQQRFNFLSSLIGAGAVAVLFHPLKQRLQGAVNKMLYGQRDDPYKVLTNLGEQVRGSADASAALKELCESTSSVLKLPFVGIWLDEVGTTPIASCGEVTEDVVSFPLTHEGATLGRLQVARRSEGEPFTANERLLLSTIAQQVSVLARNYLLTQALQVSRERLVLSREEERRRIRRDLHDGLGPTLASTAMQLETARQLIYSKPDEGASILKGLEEKMSNTLSDVRALVHNLYPTAIDQLGLYTALQNELNAFETQVLRIQLEVDGALEGLPAAVEVAVYRIVMEAVHNVQKHARATHCSVTLVREPTRLSIKIQDDGVGFEETYGSGLGLRSIRERAEELGGVAQVEAVEPRGILVKVGLPIRRLKNNDFGDSG